MVVGLWTICSLCLDKHHVSFQKPTSLPPRTAASTDTASRSLRSTSLFCLQRQHKQNTEKTDMELQTRYYCHEQENKRRARKARWQTKSCSVKRVSHQITVGFQNEHLFLCILTDCCPSEGVKVWPEGGPAAGEDAGVQVVENSHPQQTEHRHTERGQADAHRSHY